MVDEHCFELAAFDDRVGIGPNRVFLQHRVRHCLKPELGVYVMLPSNRQIPYCVRILIDFLANRLGPNSA